MKKALSLLIINLLLIANENIDDGKTDGNNILHYYKDNFTSTITNPLTNDTNFTTQSGKSFQASISCNDEARKFIDITYSGTSDIDINIEIDKNLNNSSSNYAINGVSGICSNGFIKCNSNSWDNCSYFKYSYNGDLSVYEVSLSELSGCSCINSSCQSPSMYYKQALLGDIGGTISNIVANYYPNYNISLFTHDNTHIEYYAQKQGECLNTQGDTGIGYSETDDSSIISQTEDLKSTQSDDENSAYSVVINSMNNQNTNNYTNDLDDLKVVQQNIAVDGDTNDYTFSYSSKQKDGDGNWYVQNENGSMQIDFTNTEAKYCEVKYLKINSQIHSDETEHTTQNNKTQMWQTEIRECTGENKDICPYDENIGEMIKHPCGEIDNFAEATSQLQSLQAMADDISCSN